MSLDSFIRFLDNPGLLLLEALEATSRIAVTGPGFTLSLYPVAAVASFLGIIALAPFAGNPVNEIVNSVVASVSRRNGNEYVSVLNDLQEQITALEEQDEELRNYVFYDYYKHPEDEDPTISRI